MSDDEIKRRKVIRLGAPDDGEGLTDEERKIFDLGPRERINIPVAPHVVRKQGCWNCTAFDKEALAKKRFDECRLRDVRLLLEQGHELERAEAALSATDHLCKPPMMGICLKGKGGADFVSPTYLCGSWTGRVNPHATPGAKADPLPAELLDKLGFKPRGDE